MASFKGKIFFRFLLPVLLFLVFVGADFYRFLTVPGTSTEQVFKVEQGQSLQVIALELEQKGIIVSARRFRCLAYCAGQERQIQAGEFLLPAALLPCEVLRILSKGKPVQHSLTIPEGLTWWQTGELLEQAGYCTLASFTETVHDKSFLLRHGIKASSAEGFLYPSTYFFVREEKGNARKIVSRLLRTFWEQSGIDDSAHEWKDIFSWAILASLVEKETSVPDERAKIAGVFTNRLRLKMRLQCDPTVIYGLGPDFNGNLTKANLRDRENIFNTYTRRGLPPTPICSFGRAALAAARQPERHNLLYFVAQGDGRHVFSSNLSEHNRAVRRYLRRYGH